MLGAGCCCRGGCAPLSAIQLPDVQRALQPTAVAAVCWNTTAQPRACPLCCAVEELRWPEEPLRFVLVRSFSTLGGWAGGDWGQAPCHREGRKAVQSAAGWAGHAFGRHPQPQAQQHRSGQPGLPLIQQLSHPTGAPPAASAAACRGGAVCPKVSRPAGCPAEERAGAGVQVPQDRWAGGAGWALMLVGCQPGSSNDACALGMPPACANWLCCRPCCSDWGGGGGGAGAGCHRAGVHDRCRADGRGSQAARR